MLIFAKMEKGTQELQMENEVILVGASWCGACKMMHDWFLGIEIPGVTMRYADISELPEEHVISLPTILFMENGNEIQRVTGALTKGDLTGKIRSLFKI